MEATNPFVHVFLFECGSCGNPIRLPIPDSARNLEATDAKVFALLCDICGWSGKAVGTEAKRHWVDTWALGGYVGALGGYVAAGRRDVKGGGRSHHSTLSLQSSQT